MDKFEAKPKRSSIKESRKDDKSSKRSSSKNRDKDFDLARVNMLDGTVHVISLERGARGYELMDRVCEFAELMERDYFGLAYIDEDRTKNWLAPDKKISKQMRGINWKFNFEVKFYPPDPAKLQENITRYQLCLQVKNDIISGKLPCSAETHALLGSYLVQSELGDYDESIHGSGSKYISELRFAPKQTKEMEDKVCELHRSHKGHTPEEAELQYLEKAKKLALYGVDLHPAEDHQGVNILLGVCSSGLLVYKDRLRIYRFAWPRIVKIAYRRNWFIIKVRPGEFNQSESSMGFMLSSSPRAAEVLWRDCVEHHAFFRLLTHVPMQKVGSLPGLTTKARYPGRAYGSRTSLNDGTLPAQRPVNRIGSIKGAPPTPTTQPVMKEVPAEGEWEKDAGKSAAADEERRKAMEMMKAKLGQVFPEPEEQQMSDDDGYNDKPSVIEEKAIVHPIPHDNPPEEELSSQATIRKEILPTDDPRSSNPIAFTTFGKRESGNNFMPPLEPSSSETSQAIVRGNESRLSGPKRGKILLTQTSPLIQPRPSQSSPVDERKDLTSTLSSTQSEDAIDEFDWNKKEHPNNIRQTLDSDSSFLSELADLSDSGASEKDRIMTETEEEMSPKSILRHNFSPNYDADVSNLSSPLEGNRRVTEEFVHPEQLEAQTVILESDSDQQDVFDADDISEASSTETLHSPDDQTGQIIPLTKSYIVPANMQADKVFIEASSSASSAMSSNASTPTNERKFMANDKSAVAGAVLIPAQLPKAEMVFIESEDPSDASDSSSSSSSAETTIGRAIDPTVPQPPPPSTVNSFGRPIMTDRNDELKKRLSDARLSFMSNGMTSQDTPPALPATGPVGTSRVQSGAPPYRAPPLPSNAMASRPGLAALPVVMGTSATATENGNGIQQPAAELDVLVRTTKSRIGSNEELNAPGRPASSKQWGHVRPYIYDHVEEPKRPFEPHVMGFRYYGRQPPFEMGQEQNQPTVGEKRIGLGFNYVPGDEEKVPDVRHSLKNTPSVRFDEEKKVLASVGGLGKVDQSGRKRDHPTGVADEGSSLDGFLQAEYDQRALKEEESASSVPKIVKTTTKQTLVQSPDGILHNKEEKFEDLTAGGPRAVTVLSSTNKADLPSSSAGGVPLVKATQVTTRTELTKEDKENKSTTSQIQEKTFTATTTKTGGRQEQRVVTQEVRTATILTNTEPTMASARRVSLSSTDSDDSGTAIDVDEEPPIVKTEAVKYDPSLFTSSAPAVKSSPPFVPTETRTVGGSRVSTIEGGPFTPSVGDVRPPSVVTALTPLGEVVSSHSLTSKSRTVETVTYKKEHDGLVETRVEQKIIVQSDGDPIDHDRALEEAIQEATATNPDMTVEKIEIQQTPMAQPKTASKFVF